MPPPAGIRGGARAGGQRCSGPSSSSAGRAVRRGALAGSRPRRPGAGEGRGGAVQVQAQVPAGAGAGRAAEAHRRASPRCCSAWAGETSAAAYGFLCSAKRCARHRRQPQRGTPSPGPAAPPPSKPPISPPSGAAEGRRAPAQLAVLMASALEGGGGGWSEGASAPPLAPPLERPTARGAACRAGRPAGGGGGGAPRAAEGAGLRGAGPDAWVLGAMIEVSAALLRGPVFLAGEVLECLVTLRNPLPPAATSASR